MIILELLHGKPLITADTDMRMLLSLFNVFGTPSTTECPLLAAVEMACGTFPRLPGMPWSVVAPGMNEQGVQLLQVTAGVALHMRRNARVLSFPPPLFVAAAEHAAL